MNMGIILDVLPIDKSVTDKKYLKAVALVLPLLRSLHVWCYSEGMTLTKPVFYIAVFGMMKISP